MDQASQAESREIVAELKNIIIKTLQILSEKEKPLRNDVIRAKEPDRA